MTALIPAWHRLLAEFKRRKVFRFVALYGTFVFALLQVAEIVVPQFGIPANAVTWLVVVSLAGFPLALCAAWNFDLTSYRFRRTKTARSGELEAIIALPRGQRWPAGLLALLGAGLLLYGSWWSGTRIAYDRAGAKGADEVVTLARAVTPVADYPVASVAVLPFENMGGAGDEPLIAGLAEEVGNALAAIDGVRVTARTSAFAFKGRDADARTIGQELGVGSIVEGSVRSSGTRVRISVVLSRTSDGFRVWSHTWDREMTAANLFTIEEEITAEVARALTQEITRVSPDARSLPAIPARGR